MSDFSFIHSLASRGNMHVEPQTTMDDDVDGALVFVLKSLYVLYRRQHVGSDLHRFSVLK